MAVDEVITVGKALRVAMPPHCFQSLQVLNATVLCWHNCMSTMPPHCCGKALSPQCRPTVLIRRSPQQSCDVRFADKHSVSAEDRPNGTKSMFNKA